MQNNIQNNWRSLLDDPNGFPGETIRDKNEAWEKLYSKLHEKPQPRFLTWYWAAATLLVIALTVVLFVRKEKGQDSLVSIPSPAKKIKPVTKENINAEQKNSEYPLSQPKQKIKTVVSRQKNVFAKTIPSINKNLITDSIVEQLPEMVITSGMMHDSTIKTTTVATPVKKKLRVVHVNEIGQPIEYPTVNNRFNERRPFEFRIINGEIYNPANTSSSNNGLILTKPHNTSN